MIRPPSFSLLLPYARINSQVEGYHLSLSAPLAMHILHFPLGYVNFWSQYFENIGQFVVFVDLNGLWYYYLSINKGEITYEKVQKAPI